MGTTPAFGKRDSRRAAALSPVAANDCVEGQRSRKLGAPHGFGCQQTRMGVRGRRPMGSLGRRHRGWWDVRPTRRAAVVRSRSVARKSRTCSRCWQQLGTGLQLARLIGTAALTARDGAGAGGAAGRSARGDARLGGPSAGSVVGRAGRPVDVAALTRQARSCRFFCPSGADVFGTPLAGRVRWGLARRAKRSKNGL